MPWASLPHGPGLAELSGAGRLAPGRTQLVCFAPPTQYGGGWRGVPCGLCAVAVVVGRSLLYL